MLIIIIASRLRPPFFAVSAYSPAAALSVKGAKSLKGGDPTEFLLFHLHIRTYIYIYIVYIYIYIYIYVCLCGGIPPKVASNDPCIESLGMQSGQTSGVLCMANLHTKILDFRGFDSSIILILRGGVPRAIGKYPESLGQAILVGISLVGRLGV